MMVEGESGCAVGGHERKGARRIHLPSASPSRRGKYLHVIAECLIGRLGRVTHLGIPHGFLLYLTSLYIYFFPPPFCVLCVYVVIVQSRVAASMLVYPSFLPTICCINFISCHSFCRVVDGLDERKQKRAGRGGGRVRKEDRIGETQKK